MVQSFSIHTYVRASIHIHKYVHAQNIQIYSTYKYAKDHVIFRGGPLLHAYILKPYLNCVCKHDYVVTIYMYYSCVNWYMCVITYIRMYVP